MRFILRSAALAAPIAAMFGAASADHSWSTYHWARSTLDPMPLTVHDSVTSEWQTEFEIAVGEWNVSSVLNMNAVQGDESKKTRRQCNAPAGEIRVCNLAYGFTGWLGLAGINLDSNGHITRGYAKMNDSYSSYWNNDPKERRHVMCQEIGHDFGLGHTSEDGSSQNTCMDYSTSPTSLSPNAHDYEQLELMYDHTDGYDSFSTDGGGSGGDGCNAPPGKGCNKFGVDRGPRPGLPSGAIRVRNNNFSEVWVKSDEKGGLWIYHIRLAPDAAEVDDHDH